jgi:hypothetical protein
VETAELGGVRGQAGQRKERENDPWERVRKWTEIFHAFQVQNKTKIISNCGQLP